MKIKKIGLDDAVVEYGEEFVLGKISKPVWIFTSIKLDDFNPDTVDKFLKSLVVLDKSQRSLIFDKLKLKDNRFNKKTAELLMSDLISEWSRFRPKRSDEVNSNEVTWNCQEESLSDLFIKLREKMLGIDNLYRNSSLNSFVVVDKDGSPNYLHSTKKLSDLLSNYLVYRKVSNSEDGLKKMPIEHIPEKHLDSFYAEIKNFDGFKGIDFISPVPQVFNDELLSKRGYHEESGIFYSGPELLKFDGLDKVRKLIKSFPFESQDDEVNFLGVLISLFLMQKFIGQHPSIIIQGDKQNLGKTTLAECISILFQDKEPGLLPLSNDEELRKTISGIVQNNNMVLIDNIKGRSESSVVSSPALEGMITSPTLLFRLLGENKVIERPNNVLFVLTINTGSFSDDMVTRSVTLSLSKKSIKKMDYEFNPKEFVKKNRTKILSELACFVERALEINCFETFIPPSFANFKFKKWASNISQILMANDVFGFLSNQDELSKRVNPMLTAVENAVVQRILRVNVTLSVKVTASDILEDIPKNVFNGDNNIRSMVTQVGKILSQMSLIELDECMIKISKEKNSDGGNSASYRIERVAYD